MWKSGVQLYEQNMGCTITGTLTTTAPFRVTNAEALNRDEKCLIFEYGANQGLARTILFNQ